MNYPNHICIHQLATAPLQLATISKIRTGAMSLLTCAVNEQGKTFF
jgi:hypothetical protein